MIVTFDAIGASTFLMGSFSVSLLYFNHSLFQLHVQGNVVAWHGSSGARYLAFAIVFAFNDKLHASDCLVLGILLINIITITQNVIRTS